MKGQHEAAHGRQGPSLQYSAATLCPPHAVLEKQTERKRSRSALSTHPTPRSMAAPLSSATGSSPNARSRPGRGQLSTGRRQTNVAWKYHVAAAKKCVSSAIYISKSDKLAGATRRTLEIWSDEPRRQIGFDGRGLGYTDTSNHSDAAGSGAIYQRQNTGCLHKRMPSLS